MGYQGPQGAARAGRLGAGLLSLGRELLEPYRDGLREGGFDPQSARMTGLVNALVSDDPDVAWERVRPHFAYQMDSYRAYGVEGTGLPAPAPVDPDAWRGPGPNRRGLPRFQALTPAETVAWVKQSVEGLPAVGCHFWASIAGMPDDLARRHVELVCTEVRAGLADL
jgi:alkanesulfonate monooxygenase SsuD/methylene tetrahydromethanopterin reductase-like flavin-dependent oxidoreductase (luciferase family)